MIVASQATCSGSNPGIRILTLYLDFKNDKLKNDILVNIYENNEIK